MTCLGISGNTSEVKKKKNLMEYSEMRGTEIKIETYVSDKELTS